MSKKSVLKVSALAVAIAAAGAPVMASAEISGSLGATSQYLWRGLQLTTAPTINGSLDYAHDTGFYTGIWTSSESGATEYDLYVGFGGEVEGFSYDLSYIDYNYTAGGTAGEYDGTAFALPVEASTRDFQEIHVGVGFAGLSAGAYLGTGDFGHPSSDEVDTENDDVYYYISYGYDKYGITVGSYDFDPEPNEIEGGLPDYTHVDLSYALTDQFTFTASKIVAQDEFELTGGALDPNGVNSAELWDDDVLFSVSYSFAL
ncbi:MAG: TorF family putative porin [Alcanivoracaceae bacterium]|jgi:uncharacterized protein (TIGR02001 family)|nr:TorF family putative porin [Alcanivoracaceae bacterium]